MPLRPSALPFVEQEVDDVATTDMNPSLLAQVGENQLLLTPCILQRVGQDSKACVIQGPARHFAGFGGSLSEPDDRTIVPSKPRWVDVDLTKGQWTEDVAEQFRLGPLEDTNFASDVAAVGCGLYHVAPNYVEGISIVGW